MTAEQRQKLGEQMLSLRGQVADFLKEIDQEHLAMTGEQRQYLAEQMDGLHHQVSDLRQAAATFLGELDKSNQSMANELSLKLIGQRSGLATDTAAFINTISSAHQEMATQLAQELHQSVSDLRHNAATFLKATDAAHRSMATAQKQSLVKGRNQLMAEVTATREKLNIEQSAVRTDQAEAAKVWANLSQLKQKNRMTLDVAPRVKKGSATSSQAAEPSDAVDELTAIHGIGPTMARHLSDAGITSFRQLAASNPAQLYLILGKSGKLAKVETWITQAQELIR
jgi:predicted flap endonuclease-1-like 5' DNA nuclease